MEENHNMLEMVQDVEEQFGKIEIAPEVIEVIAGIAASEVDGVVQMRGNFASGVVERFGKKIHGKGIKVELSDAGIIIDVYCVMQFGISIPTVAQKVQDNIRQTLFNMTAIDAEEINVHIVGVVFEQQKADNDQEVEE